MTEAEWLAENDTAPRQLAVVHRFASVRKLQLIAAAYVRAAQSQRGYADAKVCDDVIEAAADGLRPSEELAADLASRPGHWGFTHVVAVPQEPAAVAKGLRHLVATYRLDNLRTAREVTRLVHEVVGNPYRPVVLDPAWRTDTVLAIARGMYESRDFSAMPILADALQDAGCENEDVLNHCRDEKREGVPGEPAGGSPAPAVHIRGCWVVDLVLGKE